MKQSKTLLIFITLIISLSILSISGCSNSQSAEIEQLRKQVESLEQQNADLSGNTSIPKSATVGDSKSENKIYGVNEPVTLENACEFTVKKVEIVDSFDYLKPEGDAKLLKLTIDYTSLASSAVSLDSYSDIDFNAYYLDKYEYYLSFYKMRGSDLDNWVYVDPLTKNELYLVCELPPVAVNDTSGSLNLVATFESEQVKVNLR